MLRFLLQIEIYKFENQNLNLVHEILLPVKINIVCRQIPESEVKKTLDNFKRRANTLYSFWRAGQLVCLFSEMRSISPLSRSLIPTPCLVILSGY